ncbi:MAG TPA: ABC transporter substrate-binding protein [Candidatus Binatia bacterium]
MKAVSRLWAVVSILAAILCASFSRVEGQITSKLARIGYLTGSGLSISDAFMDELRELGYADGKNITIKFQTAQGDLGNLPRLADKLASSPVDVLFAADFNSALAAKNATDKIPVVFQTLGDPVASGLVHSLPRPGRNLTGVAGFGPELGGKRLELIKEVLPDISRVAFLTDPSNAAGAVTLRETQIAANSFAVKLQVHKVKNAAELKNAFMLMKKNQVDALLVNHDPTLTAQRNYIVRLVEESRLPAIYVETLWEASGGLIIYGPNLANQFRRAATYVDKIIKGAKPADLPVEQPTKFDLVINLKAAKQIGLTIPPNVLARAERVIR